MIGEKTIIKIAEGLKDGLYDYLEPLKEAYQVSEDPFTINASIKIKPCPEGNQIDVGFSFVTGKVKDSVRRIANEKQTSFLNDQGEGE